MNPTAKGKVVELITATMHQLPNVKVQTNVFLPSRTNPERRREIDVLITSAVAGYPIHFGIECKNERSPIGTMKIDQFLAKLDDVGIPVQHGIYVSASGYTKTGRVRALDAGLRPLILRGLTRDGLDAIVAEAFQAIVFLLATVTEISVTDEDQSEGPEPMPFFVDSENNRQGWIPDLIWQDWLSGKIPSSIGDHQIELRLPCGWHAKRGEQTLPITAMSAKVRVMGLVITLAGQSEEYTLLNEASGKVEKARVNASFEASGGKYPLTAFHSEVELEAFLNRAIPVRIVQRIRLPRIKSDVIFWPPSERVHQILVERFRSFVAGNASWDGSLGEFAGIEGDDLQAVFEPIWENHPLIRKWKASKED